MGRFVYEGLALPVLGFDEDYLWMDGVAVGACDLLAKATGVDTSEFPDSYGWSELPRIGFRVRIEIAAEPIPVTEAQREWERFERQQRGGTDA